MAVAIPKAFWPYTVVAGVNDKIHFQIGAAVYEAVVAAATYYSLKYTSLTPPEDVSLGKVLAFAMQALFANNWVVDVGPSAQVPTAGRVQVRGSPQGFWLGRTSGYNLLLHSKDFSNAAWTKTAGVTVTANATTAPDGTLTADRVVYDGTNSGSFYRIYQTIATLTGAYVNSIWMRADVATTVHLRDNGAPQASLTCNLTTSWARFDVAGSYDGTGVGQLLIYSPNNNTPFTIDVWQGQLEPGSAPGVDAPTTTAAVTPATDPLFTFLGYTDNVAWGFSATAPRQHANGWYAEDPVQDDTGDLPYFQKGGRAQTVSLDGKVASYQFASRSKRAVALSFLAAHKTFIADEGSANVNEAVERLLRSGWGRFRWWPDRSVEGTFGDYVLDLERMQEMPRNRYSPGLARYTLVLPMLPFV